MYVRLSVCLYVCMHIVFCMFLCFYVCRAQQAIFGDVQHKHTLYMGMQGNVTDRNAM